MNYCVVIMFCVSQIMLASSIHVPSAASVSTSTAASSSFMMNSMKSGYNSAMKSVKSTYQSLVGKTSSGKSKGSSLSENSSGISLDVGQTSHQTATPVVSKPSVVPTASIDLSSSAQKKPATFSKQEKTSFTKTV